MPSRISPAHLSAVMRVVMVVVVVVVVVMMVRVAVQPTCKQSDDCEDDDDDFEGNDHAMPCPLLWCYNKQTVITVTVLREAFHNRNSQSNRHFPYIFPHYKPRAVQIRLNE